MKYSESITKIFFYLFFLVELCPTVLFAQDQNVVAKVGDSKITAIEFKKRFELTPQISAGSKNIDTLKSNLLYSLIAEKLWAQEAENEHLDTTDIMKSTFKIIEKMYVRDALYKTEIEDKINVSEKEMLFELGKYRTNLILTPLYSADSLEIFNLYNQLINGNDFDSLYTIHSPKLPVVTIAYGDMEKPIEDIVYKLKEGKYTAPLKSGNGWLIFKLENKFPGEHASENIDASMKKITTDLKREKADSLLKIFNEKFFKDYKVTTNGDIFWSIADKITEILQDKKKSEEIPDEEAVVMEPSDFLKIESEVGLDTLGMDFINFEQNPVTTKEFLRYLAFEGFYTKSVEPETIASALDARVRRTIENEMLAREAYKRGLENLPEVKEDIGYWRDYYLANLLKDKLIDSVSINENKIDESPGKNSYIEVNILEVLTDSLEVIDKVFSELDRGVDFRTLAKNFTKREWVKKNNGEFGFFPVTSYGEIGRIAGQLEIGDIYGPIKVPEGYSLIKLIDKRRIENDSVNVTGNSGTNDEIRLNRLKEFFKKYTARLANKYGISINENVFTNLNVEKLDMYVIRYLGFGGKITAVPLTIPFNSWVEEWKKLQKQVP